MRTMPLMLLAALATGTVAHAAPTANHLTGDYVEARTASVFAGPCHYNGELTTTGRDAELVWHVTDGAWNGVSLTGVNAVAAVTSDTNLQDAHATRRSVLWVDSRVSEKQANALADALTAKAKETLGYIVAVKRAPIVFTKKGETFQVSACGLTHLSVDAMPNHECCKMPNLVWYKPLVSLENRRVGYTRTSGITDKTLGATWTYNGQNTAFYGTFTL